MAEMKPANGSGPYLRVEVTVAVAIVTSDDRILNDDMVDGTLAFGVPIADGPAIDAGRVTTERTTAVLSQQAANISQAIRVLMEQNLAFLGPVEEGRGLIDRVVSTGPTRVVTGCAAITRVPEPTPGSPVQ